MSKFQNILDAAKGREPEREVEPTPALPSVAAAPTVLPLLSPAPPVPASPERKPGRPPGKRSNPGYVQVTAYIQSDLHHNIKLALLQDRKGQEFSELVEELLETWLRSRR
jgi:hypothetical protein